MNLLVTGGAGFIGANFVLYQRKLHPQDRVVVLDALTYAGNLNNLDSLATDPGFRFVRGDICDAALCAQLIREEHIDAIAHFAAESHVDRSILGPMDFVRTNVVGTATLLEAARAAKVPRFLHVSTDEVYGSLGPTDPAFSEDHPIQPRSPYSASKAASDHLVLSYFHTYGFPAVVTRCSNNYGPLQFPEKLIPLMILNALEGKPLPVYGDGLNIRDWLYVRDHCEAICQVLEKGRTGETYNVGGINEIKNIDVVTTICRKLDELRPRVDGSKYESLITYVKDRPGHDRRYAIDPRKIQSEIGWAPAETFESGINKTVNWYLENNAWIDTVRSGTYRDWIAQNYAGR